MFTGIIKELGTIKALKKEADKLTVVITTSLNLSPDDSVCVNGVCSTIIKSQNKEITVEYINETLDKTAIGQFKLNDLVNLEPPLKLGDNVNGHFVTGHVDCISQIKKIETNGDTKEIEINLPKELSQYIAFKGSVTIDGISLTVSKLDTDTFRVSIIPHTLKNTILGFKKIGDSVNIEVDMISRYLKRQFDERDNQTSYEYLKERGFI